MSATYDFIHIQEAIDEHKQTPSVEPRDFIDVYLGEVEKNNDDSFSGIVLEKCILFCGHNNSFAIHKLL
jgi:hypothetical protein